MNTLGAMTRRRLINLVGRAGGASAAYATMSAMGMMPIPAAYAGPPALETGSGYGKEVVILGAGIAGMTAAYELSKAGYDCTILEARGRAGGRNMTVRAGDMLVEQDGQQLVDFDAAPHLYFNPGPARLPYHHQGTLGYCREFGVALEPIVNDNRGAFFQNDGAFGGEPIRNRRIVNDSRGFVSELLAKAVNKGALDDELTALDREQFLDFVRRFGDLDETLMAYQGSSRSGYRVPPGSGMLPGEKIAPIDMAELLKSDFWQFKLYFGEGFTQGATMLQPVGGMDQIAKAFESRVGNMITYNAEVTQLRREGEGVRVVYTDATGAEHGIEADYAVCTIPFSVLKSLDADFSPAVSEAIEACHYVSACKAAFQAERRFWELDDQIYGGISWTDADVTQIWYPSGGFHEPKGVVVGAYIWSDDIGNAFGALPPGERLAKVVSECQRIHPSFGDQVTGGVSIAWHKVPFSQGGWAEWEDESRAAAYPAVTKPDGPIYFAGEHVSYLTGWQEGAVLSAHDAVRGISERVVASR